MRALIYDVSNIIFRVAAMQKVKPAAKTGRQGFGMPVPDDTELVGISMHVSLMSINKWYKKFQPDFVVFGFEGGDNWRKQYTKDHNVRRQYKANRVIDPEMKHFYETIKAFQEIMTKHTSVCCLSVPGMEGDDVIGAYCQQNASPENELIIVSGDRDYIQLTKLPGVSLVDPATGKLRNQPGDKDYEADIDYWMFLKCVRGDGGDNVPSAFPRVFETKVRKAYDDSFERMNFLNNTWTDELGQVHRVGDLMEQNAVLMDLSKQPPEIRKRLDEGIASQVANLGVYSHFQFLRFLGKYGLQRVGEDAQSFAGLFMCNQEFAKGVRKQHNSVAKDLGPAQKPRTSTAPIETKSKLLDF